MKDTFSIGTAAKILGVSTQTLRRWDQAGKLQAFRAKSGYRVYTLECLRGHIPESKAKPFLKWAGGKSQLLSNILPHVPSDFDEYIEPFLGGGALFFMLQPKSARLNDTNAELINAYTQVRDRVEDVIGLLDSHQSKHSQEYYYKIRSTPLCRMTRVERAARLIYLNKTCFNGLYRVNQRGDFNVPMGAYKNPKILDEDTLRACSRALCNTELFSMDYRGFLKAHSPRNSFIYLDPPYIPVSKYSDFDRYTENKFRIGAHFDLAYSYAELVRRDRQVLLSNSSSELSYRLYADFKIQTVQASRSINKVGASRGTINEIIVHPARIREQSFPSTRYMGAKTSLLPHISDMLRGFEQTTVLDAFCGSSVVSYHLKKLGFEVISNDFLHYSFSVATALIENDSVRLEGNDIDLLISKNRRAKNFVRTTFKDIYFSDDDNEFLDNTLANIDLLSCNYKQALARAALSRACLKRRPRGLFTYVGFRYDDGRKDLSFSLKDHFLFSIDEFNKAVFSNNRKNKAYRMSALDLNVGSPDLIYLDPPYFSKHSDNDYVRRYHFIEGLCRNWEGVEIQHKTKTRKFKKYPSPFDTKAGTYAALEKLFTKYAKSRLLLSYSSNSLPTKEELISMLQKLGKKVTLKEIDYKYSAGTQGRRARNNNAAKEYLFLAE